MTRCLIVPAAGKGSRLRSPLPKLLVPVAGRPMIDWVLDRHEELVSRIFVVAAPAFADRVAEHVASRRVPVTVTTQAEPTGMLDAILTPLEAVRAIPFDEVWITWCDQVAVSRTTVMRLVAAMGAPPRPALAFPTVTAPEPYIHFDRDPSGRIVAVRQRREGAPMPPVGEGDIGLFALSAEGYGRQLPRFAEECELGAGTGERNFLPFIPWLAGAGQPVVTVPADRPEEAVGINTPEDLARIEPLLLGAGR